MHRSIRDFFRCRVGSHFAIEESACNLFRRITLGQRLQEILIFFFNRLIEDFRIQNALIGLCLNSSNAWCRNRLRIELCHVQKALCSAATRERYDQHTGAFATCTTRTTRTVQHRFGIVRKIGVNNEIEIGQIDTTCGNVGRHADAGAPIAHCLKRVIAFRLAQFARQCNHSETAIGKPACHVLHASRVEQKMIEFWES